MKDFYIFLTFDIDQDFAPNTEDYYNRNNAEFEGFKEGLPLIISKLKGLPFSTFVRADSQIYDIYGSYDYLLKKYPSVVKQVIDNNGEFNWHIHLYEKKMQNWAQIKENTKLVSVFIKDYNQVQGIELINHKVVRIGECTMSDGLMKTMDELGIKIDSTALPGRYRDDSEKNFDWSLTKNSIYSPSLEDYRIEGEKALLIKEVPMTTIYMQSEYDDKSYKRYINLAFKTEVLFQNMKKFIQNNDFLVTITHPYEILNKGEHGLISYDIDTFQKNLETLISFVKESGKKPVFKKIGDLAHEKHSKSIF